MLKHLIATVAAVVLPLATAAEGCEAQDNGGKPETAKPRYAGDGVTQFTDGGVLQFGRGYKAVYVDTTDRQNCRWSLYTINAEGVTKVIKSGRYRTANIKVEKPARVKVYLKSSECGNWKPT